MPVMSSPKQIFQKAVRFYEAGNLKKARSCLLDIQRRQPDITDVLHLLSLVALQMGRAPEAVGYLEKAVRLAPGSADLSGLLGTALKKAGRAEDALSAFEKALAINSDSADLHFNLGNTLRDLDRSEQAIASYRRAVEINPRFIDAFVNLGLVLKITGKFEDAVASYRAAIDLDPGDAWAHTNLGNALQELGKPDEAVVAHGKALALNPEPVEFHNNLAGALVESGLSEKATDVYRRALATNPDSPDLHCGLGTALVDAGLMDEARKAYGKALDLAPDDPLARYLLGRAHLLDGNLAEGWKGLEARWQAEILKMRNVEFPQPPWQGENLRDKTILVWGEQGVGDEVLCASMVPDLVGQGAHVVLECDDRLIPLFQRSFDDIECISRNDPPLPEALRDEIDFQIPTGSLAHFLRQEMKAFPNRRNFLVPEPDMGSTLQTRYRSDDEGLLVGIAWDSKNVKFGRHKSRALEKLAPLGQIPGITLVDLQYGDTRPDRDAFAASNGIEVLHDDSIDQMADLDAFAAQVATMDLVISISNTTVHIAGALGVPCWVLLNKVPLNCWMLQRDDSPWYSSLQLFRQTRPGDWSDVIDRVCKELHGLTNA